MPTCARCHADFPNRKTIAGQRHNLSSRRFCLACSPFGKHNTRDLTRVWKKTLHCSGCDRQLSRVQFYFRVDGRVTGHCRVCTRERLKVAKQQFKQACVDYKGGKCERCGYSRCLTALDFHHRDPAKKDFGIGHARTVRFSDGIRRELDKCSLLCATCHREVEAGVGSSPAAPTN